MVFRMSKLTSSIKVPDFRSKESGIYHNLQKFDVSDPTDVFDLVFFRKNPKPFYQLIKTLRADHCRPTFAHLFVTKLYKEGLLLMSFTQNVDCLDRKSGLPVDKIVEAHGSYATQSCIDCKAPYSHKAMQEHIEAGTVPECHICGGYVKPDMTFFHESLPERFYQNIHLAAECDLAIIIGTSLQVQPFSMLPGEVKRKTPRLLLNNERVGDIGTRPDDVHFKGLCDHGARILAKELGWLDEIEVDWRTLAGEEEAKQIERNKKALTDGLAGIFSDSDEAHSGWDQYSCDENITKSTYQEQKRKPEEKEIAELTAKLASTTVSPIADGVVSDNWNHRSTSFRKDQTSSGDILSRLGIPSVNSSSALPNSSPTEDGLESTHQKY